MPDVRSDADCRRLIVTLQKPLYRGCFTLIYAYGLRITEAVTLPVSAVDSKQMLLRVIQILLGHSSLRSTEIYTHLTEPLRDELRKLLRQTTDGLFEGRRPRHG